MLMKGFPFDAVMNGDGQVVKTKENGGKYRALWYLRDVHGSDSLTLTHVCYFSNYLRD